MRESPYNTSPIPADARRRAEEGSVMVESAIVIPVLLVLAMGTIHFGHVYGIVTNLRAASAVGARAAILNSEHTTAEVCEAALTSVSTLVDPAMVLCETRPATLPIAANESVTVTLRYSIPLLIPGAPWVGDGPYTVSVQTTMR